MSNFYDMPKDILVKMLTTIQEETRKEGEYHVIEIYYKYGEFVITSHNTENELKDYLIKQIQIYHSYFDGNYFEELKNVKDLEDLIKLAKRMRQQILNNEYGYGIISVIKGQIM